MKKAKRSRALALPVIAAIGVLLGWGGGSLRAAPEYVRLSWTGATDTTMTVAWNTQADTTSEVEYGTSSGTYTMSETGVSALGNGPLGYIHEVTLAGLQPGTTYYYRVGNASDGWSAEYHFTTGPVPDEHCGEFTFVVMGDNRPDSILGFGDNWPQILAESFQHDPVFVLNGGDLVIDGDEADQWVEFLAFTEDANVAQHVPLLAVLGNHDTGPGEGNTANYNMVLALPRSTGTYGSGTEDYYHFTYGNAVFVALSTETFKGGAIPFQNQADYLDEVLTNNPKKWRIVFYHKPSYTHEALFHISHEPNEEGQNAALIPVIDEHHVDLVFTSHNHWYERFGPSACSLLGNPGSSEHCEVPTYADGTVFVVTGGAGAMTIPGILCGSEPEACHGNHHYLVVKIQHHELVMENWEAYPQTNQIVDSITITKATDGCETPGPDAGVPDAGPGPDAAPGPDGAPPAPDSGPAPDSAPPGRDSGGGPPANPDGGCDCRASGTGATGFLIPLLSLPLLCLRRRKRR